jgi:hypothetical protein
LDQKQPFRKRLDQKQPFRKRLDQKQPFRKRLDQKLEPMGDKISSEAGCFLA